MFHLLRPRAHRSTPLCAIQRGHAVLSAGQAESPDDFRRGRRARDHSIRVGRTRQQVVTTSASVLSIVGPSLWATALARAQLVHAVCTWGRADWQLAGRLPDSIGEILDAAQPSQTSATWAVCIASGFTIRVQYVDEPLPPTIPELKRDAAALAVVDNVCRFRQGSNATQVVDHPDLVSARQFAELRPLFTR